VNFALTRPAILVLFEQCRACGQIGLIADKCHLPVQVGCEGFCGTLPQESPIVKASIILTIEKVGIRSVNPVRADETMLGVHGGRTNGAVGSQATSCGQTFQALPCGRNRAEAVRASPSKMSIGGNFNENLPARREKAQALDWGTPNRVSQFGRID
jgi:hypothetical protein